MGGRTHWFKYRKKSKFSKNTFAAVADDDDDDVKPELEKFPSYKIHFNVL
jgi:hypothetical protein